MNREILTPQEQHLIDELRQRYQKLGVSDQQFADLLKVERSTWTRLKLGSQGLPQNKVVGGIAKAFRDSKMKRLLWAYLTA